MALSVGAAIGNNPAKVCKPGYFGDASSEKKTDVCTGECDTGYWCGRGTKTNTPVDESTGWLSVGGAIAGKCPPGQYGGTTGRSSPYCSGRCGAGYYCLEGSTSENPSGSQCAAGVFSDSSLLGSINENCGGYCAPGYQCKVGSRRPEGVTVGGDKCPAGRYCICDTTSPAPLVATCGTNPPMCPTGKFSSVGSRDCRVCPSGRYSDAEGTSKRERSGKMRFLYCSALLAPTFV